LTPAKCHITNTNTNSDLYSAAYRLSRGANKMSKRNIKQMRLEKLLKYTSVRDELDAVR